MKVSSLIYIYITLSLVSLTYATESAGQAKTPQATIQEAEFIIEKERKNQLAESSRLFKKAPLPLPSQQTNFKLKYVLYDVPTTFQPLAHKIKILKDKHDRIDRLYGNYLQLGYGNYHMPYLAAFLENTTNTKYAYGLHLGHLSEGKDSYAEEHHNTIDLHGKVFVSNIVMGGSIDYTWDKYPYIHFINDPKNTANDPIKHQAYNQLQLHTRGYIYPATPFNFQYHADLIRLKNHQDIQENQMNATLEGGYLLNETLQLQAEVALHLSEYMNHPTSVTGFKPSLVTKFNDFTIQTGTNLAYQNDTTVLAKNFSIYPDLKLTYTLNQAFRPYIGLSGTIKNNSWQDYITQNPWLTSSVDIHHTHQNFIGYAGAQSDMLGMLTCHTGLSVSNYYNWPCFVNNSSEPREFDIKYDTSATVLDVFTELTKNSFGAILVTRLRAKYFYYKLTTLEKAWHRPHYILELFNTYNFHDKILVKNNLQWLGGIQALDPDTQATKSLRDVIDVDLGLEYLWNQRFSIFINCKNILARANNHYLYTPNNGLHILLGLSYGW